MIGLEDKAIAGQLTMITSLCDCSNQAQFVPRVLLQAKPWLLQNTTPLWAPAISGPWAAISH